MCWSEGLSDPRAGKSFGSAVRCQATVLSRNPHPSWLAHLRLLMRIPVVLHDRFLRPVGSPRVQSASVPAILAPDRPSWPAVLLSRSTSDWKTEIRA
jgi:hypothetical protein